MTRVKICSVQDVSHAVAAAEAGADYVGFNFVPGVRRQLSEDKARRMIRDFRQQWGHSGPKLIGIFVDQPFDEVNRILDECGLDMAQLSGQEPPSYCARVERPVVKAIHVPSNPNSQPDTVVETLDGMLAELEAIGVTPLLDPHVAGHYGGAGVAFDWAIARELASRHKLVLAGGLTPENVAEAIRQVRPWGVDVSSGVETDGIKDTEKIRAFVMAAKGSGTDKERSSQRPIRMLFVCKGNTCRSPMAAALAGRQLGALVEAESAGVDADEDAARPEALGVMQNMYGIDISRHVPRNIEATNLAEFDHVIALDSEVARRLARYYPGKDVIVWDVDDPYEQDMANYEDCARQILELIRELGDQLDISNGAQK